MQESTRSFKLVTMHNLWVVVVVGEDDKAIIWLCKPNFSSSYRATIINL